MFSDNSIFENNNEYINETPYLSFENFNFSEPEMNSNAYSDLYDFRNCSSGEMTPNSATKSQSWNSSLGDNNSVVEEQVQPTFFRSCELQDIRDCIQNENLDDVLEKYVFCDLDLATEIQPLGTIECATKNKKIRKSPAQKKILQDAYEKNDEWDKNYMQFISGKTGLTVDQVYKWYASTRYSNDKQLPKARKGAKSNKSF